MNGRKSVFWPLGRLITLGGGWYWRSLSMEEDLRVCSIVSRQEVDSFLERLISRLWIVGLSRTWMLAILGFDALKGLERRARCTVKINEVGRT